MLCLASFASLLTLSTFVDLPEGLFITFVILTGVALAGAGAYLQTSVIAVASLFGPSIIQSMMSGQAIIAVILSSVQLLSGSFHQFSAVPIPGYRTPRRCGTRS